MRNFRPLPLICAILALVLSITIAPLAAAQTVPQAMTTVNASLRQGPGRNYGVVVSLSAGFQVTVDGRNASADWLLVHTPKSTQGWLAVNQIRFLTPVDVQSLPVQDGTNQTAPLVAAAGAPAVPPTSAFKPIPIPGGDPAIYAAKITPAIHASMRAVYVKGLGFGNNPRVFSKVGDCHTGHVWFLHQFGGGHTYNLGPYTRLKGVIDYFTAPPRPGIPDSFVTLSQAAHSGFMAPSVLDPTWADPGSCQANETPLHCEYRLDKPSVAIIQFGILDPGSIPPDVFSASMNQIVDQTMALGIIPILSTAPENPVYPDRAKVLNGIVVAIARSKNIPLINLAKALDALPNKGLDADRLHLTPALHFGGIEFAGPTMQTGLAFWNLLALQSLDSVWREIMQ